MISIMIWRTNLPKKPLESKSSSLPVKINEIRTVGGDKSDNNHDK